jgi:protein-tyrosine-phosphatase
MDLILVTSPDSGRAAMAAAFFNLLVTPSLACSIAAVAEPNTTIPPLVTTAFDELATGRPLLPPSRLTTELGGWAAEIIYVGCSPSSFPVGGIRASEWDIPDPTHQPVEEIRAIRDAIQRCAATLLRERGWSRELSTGSRLVC